MRSRLKFSIPVLCVFLLTGGSLSGCSFIRRLRQPSVSQVPEHGSAESAKEPPLDVEVVDSALMNGELVVKVQLRAKTQIDPNAVALALTTLVNGQVSRQEIIALNELLTEPLPAGGVTAVLLRTKASEASEFQVRCSWGDEARSLMLSKRSGAAAATGVAAKDSRVPAGAAESIAQGLDVRRVGADGVVSELSAGLSLVDMVVDTQETKCSFAPCDINYIVSAQLVNQSSEKRYQRIALAVGLQWENAGKKIKTPESYKPLSAGEDEAALDSVVLAPGQAKKVRIRIDQPVPVVPGGRFVPYLRVLRAEES